MRCAEVCHQFTVQEQHQIDKLFGHLLEQLIRQQPAQPVPWLIEALQNPDFAAQPPQVRLALCKQAQQI